MGYIVGVDIGLKGAIAWIDEYGNLEIDPMPINDKERIYDAEELAIKFKDADIDMVYIEAPQFVRPKKKKGSKHEPMHVSKNFQKVFINFGRFLAILELYQVPYTILGSPRTWQKMFWSHGADTKQQSIRIAQNKFPSFDFRRNSRCRVPDHNYTDATLIAAYGRQLCK